MESLVVQPGEPLITFGEPADGTVSVTQRRFFSSPSIKTDPAQKWTIPVCFKTGADKQDCEVLTPDQNTLKVPAAPFFFANAGGKGYYRSAYPPNVYAGLVAHVETDLTPTERISLTGDEWAQVRANKATVGDYLDLVAAIKADPNAAVVSNSLSGVDAIYARVAGTQQEKDAVAAWLRRTFATEYAKLGAPSASDSANTKELRASFFGLLGYAKDPAVLAEAHDIAEKYLADPASVDATMGQTALSIAARNGNVALFDQLQKIAETSTNPEFQEGALRLLAQFQDPALVERSLEYASSNKVRNQDALIQFVIELQSGTNRDAAWKYIKDHWDTVKTLLTPELGSALVGSTGTFCSAEARDDVQAFFADHKVPSAERAVKHSAESINGCIELRSLQQPNLDKWIAAQTKM